MLSESHTFRLIPHCDLEKSVFCHFVGEVTGAQSGQMTLLRAHTRGGIQDQVENFGCWGLTLRVAM